MPFTKQLIQLRNALAILIPFREDAIPFLDEANINWRIIIFSQNPTTLWHNILSYTDNNNLTDELVDVLLKHFPGNPHLLSYREQLSYNLGPALKETDVKGKVEPKTLEKIMAAKSTLLPISFLQTGLERAKSVARVLIKRPNQIEAGTGFLLPNNLFLTNNHVINDIETAKITTIQFGYEKSASGLDIVSTDFMLEPDSADNFATSIENDWTAVRIKGDANKLFGAIKFTETVIVKDDFVNIIQHPGGRDKQIGMYHNIVTYSDSSIVQYLTDTEEGSSGAPVFNSQWEVVALHHMGGMLVEPGSNQLLLRNEGINIKMVMEGIKASNLQ
ncbi:MAG: trypsin-like peptidase domain-containing protein [Ferruginibacter sp.]